VAEPLVVGRVVIPASDLAWAAVRASGPGGQNVNKVSSKIELRFALATTTALDAGTKRRLATAARSRIDRDGQLLIVSQKTRDQQRNLEDARDKLAELVRAALTPPPPRRPTRPTFGSKKRRLEDKRRTGEKKAARRGGDD
jgi:ribosome-associated protein